MTFDKLYTMLLESSNTHSWLSPTGDFHPLIDGNTHTDWADEYYAGDIDHPLYALMKNGWQRVTPMFPTLITCNDFKLPNKKQITVLKQLAWDKNFEKLEWDGGKRNRILWTQNDIL